MPEYKRNKVWPCKTMLRPNVHVVRLTASTAMIQENISLLRANTRRSVPSFPYPVPTSVRLGVLYGSTQEGVSS